MRDHEVVPRGIVARRAGSSQPQVHAVQRRHVTGDRGCVSGAVAEPMGHAPRDSLDQGLLRQPAAKLQQLLHDTRMELGELAGVGRQRPVDVRHNGSRIRHMRAWAAWILLPVVLVFVAPSGRPGDSLADWSAIAVVQGEAHAQALRDDGFDAYFVDKTMRVDYFHSGGLGHEILSLDQVVSDGAWAGSRIRLVDELNLGKYLFEVIDRRTNRVNLLAGLRIDLRRVGNNPRVTRGLPYVSRVAAVSLAETPGPSRAQQAGPGQQLPRDLVDGRRPGLALRQPDR